MPDVSEGCIYCDQKEKLKRLHLVGAFDLWHCAYCNDEHTLAHHQGSWGVTAKGEVSPLGIYGIAGHCGASNHQNRHSRHKAMLYKPSEWAEKHNFFTRGIEYTRSEWAALPFPPVCKVDPWGSSNRCMWHVATRKGELSKAVQLLLPTSGKQLLWIALSGYS